MSKGLAFMLVIYVAMAMAVGILEGGGGIAATELTSSIDDDDTTLNVQSTEGFKDEDVVYVGDEEIYYEAITDTTFATCTRGYDDTEADSHDSGTQVYTEAGSVANSALGFDVASTVDSMGTWSVIVIPFQFLFVTIPHVLIMPYTLFSGDLMIFAIILMVIQAAIIITIAISLTGARRV